MTLKSLKSLFHTQSNRLFYIQETRGTLRSSIGGSGKGILHNMKQYWRQGKGISDETLGTQSPIIWYWRYWVRFMVFKLLFQQYLSYIMVGCFIGGGIWSTLRKPLTCHKSLTNIMLYPVHHAMSWVRSQNFSSNRQ